MGGGVRFRRISNNHSTLLWTSFLPYSEILSLPEKTYQDRLQESYSQKFIFFITYELAQ
jgi:hypothetical protein